MDIIDWSVGTAFPGTELKIAEDGEVLIKGQHVMKGYYKNEKATAETIIDEWLHTGDVGKIDVYWIFIYYWQEKRNLC